MPFRISLGYNTEKGTLKTSKYERYTGAVNLSPKFFDNHLSVDINVKGTINKNRFADSGAVGAAAFFDPSVDCILDIGGQDMELGNSTRSTSRSGDSESIVFIIR